VGAVNCLIAIDRGLRDAVELSEAMPYLTLSTLVDINGDALRVATPVKAD
jgi:hypothetical protein